MRVLYLVVSGKDDDAFALSEPSSLTASLINQFGSPLGTIVSIDILALL